jgi:hypothetical protein
MKYLSLAPALLLAFSVTASAGDEVLKVTGSGKPGTYLTFTVSTKTVEPHRIAFLGISPALGKTEFSFVTMDLAMPIWAMGMGSLGKGSVSRRVLVPGGWPPNQMITFYAQAVIVIPAGAGHTGYTTAVLPFVIKT